MKIIKINISTDVEGLMVYKRIIDDYWISIKKIEERTTIEQFIESLDMSKQLYIKSDGNKVIPFTFININKVMYFFYVEQEDGIIDDCLSALKEIDFDFLKLTKVSDSEIVMGKLKDKNYFVVNGEYCLNEN